MHVCSKAIPVEFSRYCSQDDVPGPVALAIPFHSFKLSIFQRVRFSIISHDTKSQGLRLWPSIQVLHNQPLLILLLLWNKQENLRTETQDKYCLGKQKQPQKGVMCLVG